MLLFSPPCSKMFSINTVSSIAGFDKLTAHSPRNLKSIFVQFPKYILELKLALFWVTWRQSKSCLIQVLFLFKFCKKGSWLFLTERKDWIMGKSIKKPKFPANQNTLAMCSLINWNYFVTEELIEYPDKPVGVFTSVKCRLPNSDPDFVSVTGDLKLLSFEGRKVK